jgi:hypothetical protein
MRKFGIIAVLALLVTALAAIPASAAITTTFNNAAAPTGTHVQTGTPTCSVSSTGLVTCSSYELAGVGNTNAQATLLATYTATVNCTNHGGNLVPVKSSVQTAPASTGQLSPQNGRLTVPSLTSSPVPTDQQFTDQATCPNGNWTKSVAPGSITLSSFTYTLHFVGFTGNYITITGP